MAALSNIFENKLVDFMFRGQALGLNGASAAAGTGPANLYVGLLTAASGEAGGGTEVSSSGTAYARAAVASSLANWAGTQGAGTTAVSSGTTGTTSNNNIVSFISPTADWGLVIQAAVYDAPTGGNLLFYASLAFNKTINAQDLVSFPAGSLTFQIDN
jgi:hypothetical protein